jgi:hypothetical protein
MRFADDDNDLGGSKGTDDGIGDPNDCSKVIDTLRRPDNSDKAWEARRWAMKAEVPQC